MSSKKGQNSAGNASAGSTANALNNGKKRGRNMPTANSSSQAPGKNGTEVKISFGPSRPPSMSNGRGKTKNSSNSNNSNQPPFFSSSSAAAAASMAAMMGAGDGNICFGDIDLDALKEKAAAAAAGQKTFRNKHGLPCTEAEMKALMGMFVEIMGMSMNGSNNNKGGGNAGAFGPGNMVYSNDDTDSHKNGSSPVFSFGANPMDASSLAAMAAAASGSTSGMLPDHMAAATAGFFADGTSWEALRRTFAAEQMAAAEYDDEDDESFENRELTFEELEFLLHHRKQKEEAAKLASQFASGDWESLDHVATDHLLSETDEKERKAAKKREKKQRRKAKLKEEAAQKAAEAAQKKREKAVISWRSRVVSACQSNEITKLEGLLQDSPLRKLAEEENAKNHTTGNASIISHLEFLLPNSVAKNRAQVERGIDARLKLAEYVLETELSLAFKPLRTGRTALHTACFHGDVKFLQLLFDKIESYKPAEGESQLPTSFLNLTCDESGWSPLHYAALSGSSESMELLLAKGSDLATRTDDTHTWRESDGKGLTARELVHIVQSGKYEEVIETHGLALQEMTNAFFNHHQERRIFMTKLDRVHYRLSDIEKNGYTPLSKDKTDSAIDSDLKAEDAAQSKPEGKKKKKKKKKKQNGKDAVANTAVTHGANQQSSSTAPSNSAKAMEEKDPLVTALLGMGFGEEQIIAAVKACGGTHRATADDLVTWILGQGENEEPEMEFTETKATAKQPKEQINQSQNQDSSAQNELELQQQRLEEARQKEEAARRLAAKREEARRRNREWNNREQARQKQEANAKVAQKLYTSSTVPVASAGALASNGIHTSHMTRNAIPGIKPPAKIGNKWGVPPVTTTSTPSQAFPRLSGQQNAATPTTNSTTPTSTEQLPVTSFFAIDDDRTVSSIGSSRCMSVSSKEVMPLASNPSVPPPGFSSNGTQPMTAPTRPNTGNPTGVSYNGTSRQGEIRATAKEFVPSFTLPDTSAISEESKPKEAIPSNDKPPLPSNQSYDVGLPPGLLPQQGSSAINGNSLLVSGLQSGLPNSFDNAPSMTPATTASILPGAAFLGAPKADEPAMSIPFGFGQDAFKESNDIGGSRLLGSISRNAAAGGSSLWGNTQNIPSLGNSLDPSFFADSNGINDEKNSSSWQMPTGGNSMLPNSGGQGSIW